MKVYSVHFGDDPLYERMKKVLAHSIKIYSRNTSLTVHKIEEWETDLKEAKRKNTSGHDTINALKTKYHNDIVQNSRDGEFICLLDLDMAVFGDLSEAEGDFDLGYTVRQQRARINSGVIFVRISPKTKEWYRHWNEIVWNLLDNPGELRKLKRTYSGINQTALAIKLGATHDLILKEFPCSVWNCTPIHYKDFNPSRTKLVHLLNHGNVLRSRNRRKSTVAESWNKLEKEANQSSLQ